MQAAGEAGWIGRACCPGGPWASRTAERRPGWALSRLPTPAAGSRRGSSRRGPRRALSRSRAEFDFRSPSKRLRDNLRQICRGFGIGIRRNGRGGCLAAPRPPPRQCFRSPRINSANARFGHWDAWQALLSALTWPNVGTRFEVPAERRRMRASRRSPLHSVRHLQGSPHDLFKIVR